ncbi:hypothetical protein DIJ63_07100 [Burkholderia pseudomallei]|nr:hypothetical protein CF640_09350 [Burkholderia pseudomallei]PNX23365.1 hypothetical protein CF645_05710 [Burkholderia pseudomallei]TPB76488.1 hypothetical protein DIJ63_07100 [Burkholderia pseudomallei]
MPRLPAMMHGPLSHSFAVFFVHEAYHHQGLSQYDNGVMLRTETRKSPRRVSISFSIAMRFYFSLLEPPSQQGCREYENYMADRSRH